MRKATRRRRLSMTSLIDIIFLLLLFFMLSSTFSKFSEVELAAAGAGSGGEATDKPSFLQLDEDRLRLNGQEIALGDLIETFTNMSPTAESLPVIVSLRDDVTSQRLTDVLVVLRQIDRLSINVLGS